MATTPHLGLTLVEQSQAQKEVTVNQAFSLIDALLNTGAQSRVVSVPPGSPALGDMYIVGPSPSGAWAGKAGKITYFDQLWRFVSPRTGMTLWVADEGLLYTFNGSNWLVSGIPIFAAPTLAPLLATDLFPVIRGGVLHLATLADFPGVVGGGGGSSMLNFSIAGNSGLLGVL